MNPGSRAANLAGGVDTGGRVRSHEVEYKVFGDDLQYVEVELDPTEPAGYGCSRARSPVLPTVSPQRVAAHQKTRARSSAAFRPCSSGSNP
jgi:hypothetical protein